MMTSDQRKQAMFRMVVLLMEHHFPQYHSTEVALEVVNEVDKLYLLSHDPVMFVDGVARLMVSGVSKDAAISQLKQLDASLGRVL